ncbi:MAG: hypothetical protein WCR54_06310 [Clostridia bacterium]
MDNQDINKLVDAFIQYKEMLTPIQGNLNDFVITYDKLKEDIDKLNNSFGGDAAKKMEQIYQSLANQASNASQLSTKIDKFVGLSDKYLSGMNTMINAMDKISKKIEVVDRLEEKAESQIALLDELLEEKKKNYDISQLQKTLANYNSNVQKVSEFINKDVADSIGENSKKLDAISNANEKLSNKIEIENENVTKLIEKYSASSNILNKIVEKEDVNEIYLFEILDKWAESRKIKKKDKN